MINPLYFPWWYFQCRFLGRRIPLQSVVFITTRCNLRCRHCAIVKAINEGRAEAIDRSYDDLVKTFKTCYAKGARVLDLEGGEPFLWRDEARTIEDLIAAARATGFFSVTVTTNGTQPIETSADLVWVSLDGVRPMHDDIRGAGCFDTLMQTVEESGHPRIHANMVINNRNYTCVEQVVKLVADTPNLQMISLNFHTPHRGVEDLLLPWDERREVVDSIIAMKRAGYPIINSYAGLWRMRSNLFDKRCWITNFSLPDGTLLDECQGSREGVCDDCGYGMGPEMSAVYDLRLSSILAGLALRSARRR